MGISKEVKERMQTGKLYFPTEEDLLSEQAEWMELLYDFNSTRPSEGAKKRAELLVKTPGRGRKELLCGTASSCQLGMQYVYGRRRICQL